MSLEQGLADWELHHKHLYLAAALVYSNHPESLQTSEIYPPYVYCGQLQKHTFFTWPMLSTNKVLLF